MQKKHVADFKHFIHINNVDDLNSQNGLPLNRIIAYRVFVIRRRRPGRYTENTTANTTEDVNTISLNTF